MKVDDIIGYAVTNGKVQWWFKLTWGAGQGWMWALEVGVKLQRYGINGKTNRTRIDLQDYDICLNVLVDLIFPESKGKTIEYIPATLRELQKPL